MKPSTVALLILMNMMCTMAYFDHASFLGAKTEETTLLMNSYESNEETRFTKGINLGRKLMDSSLDSSRVFSVSDINRIMNPGPHP
ncbi:unnamed protein product [Miscanthus lutarioriparius]|uniref:Uncharacterized protein n=1 Tax=Miscanthus lutarioriparius TaxID=422564 RepID=A0A811QK65_9POAL|nr:unnamed protein product [Miscanthus lutarioriparius]